MSTPTSFDGTPASARFKAVDELRLANVLALQTRVQRLEGMLGAFATREDCWCAHDHEGRGHSVRCLQVRSILNR